MVAAVSKARELFRGYMAKAKGGFISPPRTNNTALPVRAVAMRKAKARAAKPTTTLDLMRNE